MTGTRDEPALDEAEAEILVTAIRGAARTSTGAALDRSLDEIGWTDALDLVPRVAVGALFDEQGRSGSTSGALGRLLLHTLGVGTDRSAVVVLPAFGSSAPPASVDGVHGLGTHDLASADHAVVVAAGDPTPRWCVVPTAALQLRAVDGLDPRLGLVEVTDAPVDLGDWSASDADWADAVAVCRLALGHELVGAMRTMLELARTHALDRVQFDRPIAGFQAVRHRLAESLVAIEAAEASLEGAWQDGSPLAAALAKVVCGESSRTVRRHCQQVLAGIGFTDEHDLHLFVRRTIVLDGLLGDARTLAAEVGACLLETRQLPGLLPL